MICSFLNRAVEKFSMTLCDFLFAIILESFHLPIWPTILVQKKLSNIERKNQRNCPPLVNDQY